MIRVPQSAKQAAKEGLRERLRNGAGLTPEEAKRQGIASGVSRARQLIRQEYISKATAQRISNFYERFKNKDGPRAQTAHKLWGGRRFARSLKRQLED